MDMKDDKAFEDKIDGAVSRALEKEPSFELRPGFADRVMSMIREESTVKEQKRDRLWLIVGIASMFCALIFVITKVEFGKLTAGVGVFTFLKGYSGLVIFGILFVIALHLFDKLVLRKQESG